ncbi:MULTISPECIES: hypothetical protein [unclassified Bradyrhizobium]|uniref:hypothetical protein n=1 Tax=unclassified Bradyrhizobium TaxID=2631580 RepID=UPI001FFA0491|nr:MULTISPECIES: hypothetical protein [unclassified Bradyrhizobium]MCK1271081.1 hypothetical protein [Bradyrhizobium sp. 84]MCK1375400.1 hypothetical protein [Bradyrhizobium sp. 49]MCK1418462.1 hypothetical protein [Bradyrhizobium sp. CW4]MCK1426756.1 hypothetical protein [Bradyrhizobium sp. 87]
MHPSHVVRNGSKSTEWMATVAAASSVVAAALTPVACPDSQMGSGFCLLFADSDGENTQPWHGKLVVIVYKATASKTLNNHRIIVSR